MYPETSQCTVLSAEGILSVVDTTLYFDAFGDVSVYASDMLITVSDNGTMCYQYGGTNEDVEFIVPDCVLRGAWNASWDSSDTGTYVDTAQMNINSFSKQWIVCMANGNVNSSAVSYAGQLVFSSLKATAPATESPTPTPSFSPSAASEHSIEVASECNQPLKLEFDTILIGGDFICTILPASNSLLNVNVSLYFEGSVNGEFASDMLLVVNLVNRSGIEIGGFDYYLPNSDYAGPWPSSWNQMAEGWYSASINVTSYRIGGTGLYSVCIANGFSNAASVGYSGVLNMEGLNYQCGAPTAMPTDRAESSDSENKGDLSTNDVVLISVFVPLGVLGGVIALYFLFISNSNG